MRPTVTLAIPVYNSAATLERCLRSATAQTLRDIEILVANDGSTDASGEVATMIALDDSRIRVLHIAENGGKSRAMNLMAAEARGVWFAVLDADDVLHESRLERLVRAAETAGVEMAADNLEYFDCGANRVVRSGFDPKIGGRILDIRNLLKQTSSFAEFDFGLLKPLVLLDFVHQHKIFYYEHTRLAEDFFYLLEFFIHGGRCYLIPEPLYRWTLPFGTMSRKWTTTGLGPWRYDYRQALRANDNYIARMTGSVMPAVVDMLQERGKQYRVMVHYLDAQRAASEGQLFQALWTILRHPSTYRLLLLRVAGRLKRAIPQMASAGGR